MRALVSRSYELFTGYRGGSSCWCTMSEMTSPTLRTSPCLRLIRSAISPVQPVWCEAPSPAPLSPSKYSLKTTLSRQAGSPCSRPGPPKQGRRPSGPRVKFEIAPPGVAARLTRGSRGRLRRVAVEPAGHVVVVRLLAPQHPGTCLAHDHRLVGGRARRRQPGLELPCGPVRPSSPHR